MYGDTYYSFLFNYYQIQEIARKVKESTADIVILGGDINSDPRPNEHKGRNLIFVDHYHNILSNYVVIRKFTFS